MDLPVSTSFQLRTYCYLDELQPRYAAFLGTVIQGDLPVVGMASVIIEVAPGSEVFRLVDIALKAARARPGAQVVEREFGLLELHSHDQSEVQAAGRAVLSYLGMTPANRTPPAIVSMQVIKDVDSYQAQLLNRFRRGESLISLDTLLVVECAPAAYANYIINEVEKVANIHVIHVTGLGRFGRVWVSGTESDIQTAKTAVEAAVASLQEA